MKLANMIRERISNLQGEIGVYFYDIKQDNSFFVGNCDVFPSLGIAKLVLLIEVFRQVEEKVIRLTIPILWTKNHHLRFRKMNMKQQSVFWIFCIKVWN